MKHHGIEPSRRLDQPGTRVGMHRRQRMARSVAGYHPAFLLPGNRRLAIAARVGIDDAADAVGCRHRGRAAAFRPALELQPETGWLGQPADPDFTIARDVHFEPPHVCALSHTSGLRAHIRKAREKWRYLQSLTGAQMVDTCCNRVRHRPPAVVEHGRLRTIQLATLHHSRAVAGAICAPNSTMSWLIGMVCL